MTAPPGHVASTATYCTAMPNVRDRPPMGPERHQALAGLVLATAGHSRFCRGGG
jgi:hypothetical protein